MELNNKASGDLSGTYLKHAAIGAILNGNHDRSSKVFFLMALLLVYHFIFSHNCGSIFSIFLFNTYYRPNTLNKHNF